MDAVEVTPLWLINGLVRTISQIKLVHHIWHTDMITVLVVLQRLNVKIVLQERDAGLKKEQKFMESVNMEL
jgi:hypothetical protein